MYYFFKVQDDACFSTVFFLRVCSCLAVVTTPSGQRHYPKLEDNRNSTVKIKYQPTEIGLHTLDVTYNQSPVAGSPFKFYVDSIGMGHVTAYGPGLSHGISGQLCHFTIVTKDAGAGALVELIPAMQWCTGISARSRTDRFASKKTLTVSLEYTELSDSLAHDVTERRLATYKYDELNDCLPFFRRSSR